MVNPTPDAARLSRMKRRLRKKLYLGEFQEHAFELKADFKPGLSEDGLDALLDAFIDTVEARDLDFVGGFDAGWLEGTVMSAHRYQSPSEEDRQALIDWLKAREEVAEVNASNFFDAWYGWE